MSYFLPSTLYVYFLFFLSLDFHVFLLLRLSSNVHLLPFEISITSEIPITISPQIDAKEPFKSRKKNKHTTDSVRSFVRLVHFFLLLLIDWNRMSSSSTTEAAFCRLFQFEFDFFELMFTYAKAQSGTRSLFLSEFRRLYLWLSKQYSCLFMV